MKWSVTDKLLILAMAWLLLGGKLPSIPGISTTKATAATYVFEKDQHVVPNAVEAALDKLNRQTPPIIATIHEVDATDETGAIPEQYKLVVPAAKEAGLPSLVVVGGDKVLKVVKAPTTEEQVMEAVGLLSSFDERHKRFMERDAAK